MHCNVFPKISGDGTIFRAPGRIRVEALNPVSIGLLVVQSNLRNDGHNADLRQPRLRLRAGAARTPLICGGPRPARLSNKEAM
jgi:hypothetical protein